MLSLASAASLAFAPTALPSRLPQASAGPVICQNRVGPIVLQNEMEPDEGWYVRTLRLRLLAAWLTCFQSHTQICARFYCGAFCCLSLRNV